MNSAPLKSIVLLDDEKSYTELMCQMLESNLDCRVATFTRPADALRALAEVNPAVVVTDYHMPQVNGLDFIRQAAPLVPAAAFVLITGHNLTSEEEVLARLRPLRGYLPKPFGWRKLADEIIRVWPTHTPAPTHRNDAATA